MLKNKWINYIGVVFLVIIIFVIGFYFGYKNAKSSASTNQTSSGSFTPISTAESKPQTEIKAVNVDGVMWIKAGQDPICPSDHPVKGTFSDNFGNYYTKDNNRYDRIKPDICFATEEFARDTAGFIKKF